METKESKSRPQDRVPSHHRAYSLYTTGDHNPPPHIWGNCIHAYEMLSQEFHPLQCRTWSTLPRTPNSPTARQPCGSGDDPPLLPYHPDTLHTSSSVCLCRNCTRRSSPDTQWSTRWVWYQGDSGHRFSCRQSNGHRPGGCRGNSRTPLCWARNPQDI